MAANSEAGPGVVTRRGGARLRLSDGQGTETLHEIRRVLPDAVIAVHSDYAQLYSTTLAAHVVAVKGRGFGQLVDVLLEAHRQK